MEAGGRELQSRGSAAIDVRRGIDFGTRLQQNAGDLDDILRRLLPVAFDAICRDIVEQDRAMLACRTRMHQIGLFAQQLLEGCGIAGDDGVGCGLKSGHRRRVSCECLKMLYEFRPAFEAVRSRHYELRIGKSALSAVGFPAR
jgi:hypothetical protein